MVFGSGRTNPSNKHTNIGFPTEARRPVYASCRPLALAQLKTSIRVVACRRPSPLVLFDVIQFIEMPSAITAKLG